MPELSRARLRELERIHILRTLMHHGPVLAADLVQHANTECDDALFDGLPEISPDAVGAKLNALANAGLVLGKYDDSERRYWWEVTSSGRETAELFGIADTVDAELVRVAVEAFFRGRDHHRRPEVAMKRALIAAFALAGDRSTGEGRV